ncbi:MAG: hypothetical protein A3D67_00270 [Candidatus Lloydbacteria bacterium RIFCSPHIGHO2_02_FULL_51_22]|uniref:30S ribosomal protein S21 n=3 Tax=Candidatus Lloydiibacteriota TaxID=1817910 RepID=A0A1G2DD76_9BACT|nr:MAG: hypothetical protein A3D67_00270 [Candidatus Lloydbacteria bacterium RIFCSPHIGHO2_02_FULL_51_22]OGZ15721.1 MAG: hypothetical protein A3J08_02555 [Candidatus Lloydbacteria bacterium RIFCSPLOWO2_02_FULL_51_11]OGZ17037.1 MAG: hypothetical protein A3G11_00630 [Candidatus Lloydbacteria bacterium RIFCSPLOWO2_12_FULL_51_9]
MTQNAEVEKNQNETNLNLIRRFTKRVQGARALNQARALRFRTRVPSKLKKKVQALKRIAHGRGIERLKKLGKYKPPANKRRGR